MSFYCWIHMTHTVLRCNVDPNTSMYIILGKNASVHSLIWQTLIHNGRALLLILAHVYSHWNYQKYFEIEGWNFYTIYSTTFHALVNDQERNESLNINFEMQYDFTPIFSNRKHRYHGNRWQLRTHFAGVWLPVQRRFIPFRSSTFRKRQLWSSYTRRAQW